MENPRIASNYEAWVNGENEFKCKDIMLVFFIRLVLVGTNITPGTGPPNFYTQELLGFLGIHISEQILKMNPPLT